MKAGIENKAVRSTTMKYIYCPTCGSRLGTRIAGDDGPVPFCERCGKYWFDSFADVALVMVVNEFDEIALLKQLYMSDTYTSFVSGYIKPGETAEETAVREVREEIGVELESLDYKGTVWFERFDQLLHCYVGRAKKCELRLSREIDSAEWTPCEDVIKTIFPDSPGNGAFMMYQDFMQEREKRINDEGEMMDHFREILK